MYEYDKKPTKTKQVKQNVLQRKAEFRKIQGNAERVTQLISEEEEEEKELDEWGMSVQRMENNTGMPDSLKSNIENYSGISLNDVKVHYNSDKPSELGALAYTKGNQIYVGSGQEKHLPHEAWHVVQQKQGRVSATTLVAGQGVNDSEELESEADYLGNKLV